MDNGQLSICIIGKNTSKFQQTHFYADKYPYLTTKSPNMPTFFVFQPQPILFSFHPETSSPSPPHSPSNEKTNNQAHAKGRVDGGGRRGD
ncbi:MAG: hypothetical protein K2L39_04560, partial [Muribaculaceae bacterium]|nr:hypothetical protein [Muribaculaceae bacterium]